MKLLMGSKRTEPSFTVVDQEDCFKVFCTAVDKNSGPLNDEQVTIEKRGCVMYTSCKS